MSRATAVSLLVLVLAVLAAPRARAHCQVPCGIYDEPLRVKMLFEDHQTIAKAVAEIGALAKKKDAQSLQQLVRWVNTKEEHAEKIIRTISDYFLTQKVKAPADAKQRPAYLEQLAKNHAVMVAAMKCKQSSAPAEAQALHQALTAWAGDWK